MKSDSLQFTSGQAPRSATPVIDDAAHVATADRADAILPLELVDVGLRVGDAELIRDINLTFDGHAPSIILGPNGAGKTLLLRTCHGLLAPTTGQVRWRDPDLAMRPDSQAMVFQKPVMLRRSVAANIRFALRVSGVDRDQHAARVAQALEAAGLTPLAERRANHLSGGEQQRLALARCLAVQPRILFLDEPTAHLDPAATRQVESLIALIRDAGTRIVMITHDIGQARRLAGEVIFMHRGRIVESGDATQFFERPATAEAAAYLDGELLW